MLLCGADSGMFTLRAPQWHIHFSNCLAGMCPLREPQPLSSVSLELVALGAEVVQADLSDATSLSQKFANANAIFLKTDFWGPYVMFVMTKTT